MLAQNACDEFVGTISPQIEIGTDEYSWSVSRMLSMRKSPSNAKNPMYSW